VSQGIPSSLVAGRPAAALLVRTRADRRRSLVNSAFQGVALLAAVACVVPLGALVTFVVMNGAGALNLDLLTRPTRALGLGGGAAAAILGSLQIVPIAAVIATPIGVLAAAGAPQP